MSDLTVRFCTTKDTKEMTSLWTRSQQYLTTLPIYPKVIADSGIPIGIFQDEKLICLLPLMEQKSRAQKTWRTPLFCSFGGPVAEKEMFQFSRASERFWRDCWTALAGFKEFECDRLQLILPPDLIDVRLLQWNGWSATPHFNYVSRWIQPGEWWNIWENSVRRQVKKARDNGLHCIIHNPRKTENLVKLWKVNARKQGLEEKLFESLITLGNWLNQLEKGFVIDVLDQENNTHASGLFGFDEHRVYYLAGASDPDEAGSGAPSLLHARAFEEIDTRNLPHCYDWVGANTHNIVDFKKKFCPQLEMLMSVSWESKKSSLLKTIRSLRK